MIYLLTKCRGDIDELFDYSHMKSNEYSMAITAKKSRILKAPFTCTNLTELKLLN